MRRVPDQCGAGLCGWYGGQLAGALRSATVSPVRRGRPRRDRGSLETDRPLSGRSDACPGAEGSLGPGPSSACARMLEAIVAWRACGGHRGAGSGNGHT